MTSTFHVGKFNIDVPDSIRYESRKKHPKDMSKMRLDHVLKVC